MTQRYGSVLWLILCAPLLALDAPQPTPKELFEAAKTAVAENRVRTTDVSGYGEAEFRELPKDGAILVGFELGIGRGYSRHASIKAVRPIYKVSGGNTRQGQIRGVVKTEYVRGRLYRTQVEDSVKVVAKHGYAVGGITVANRSDLGGLSVRFMKITGDRLDPADAYDSDWIGVPAADRKTYLGGEGEPVIGIIGRESYVNCTGLGLILIKPKDADGRDNAPAPDARRSFDGQRLPNPIRTPQPEDAPSLLPPSGEWIKFKPTELKATLSLPAEPTRKVASAVTAMGKVETISYELTENRLSSYGLTFQDIPGEPGDPKARLDAACDNLLRSLASAKLVSEKDIKVKGHTARDMLISIPGPSGQMAVRQVLVGSRLYLLTRTGPQATLDNPDTRKFLDSFTPSKAK